MLISEKMNSALNNQIGQEFLAELSYVATSAYFAVQSLPELSARFQRQADEERDHALRFVKYLVDAGGSLEIPAIPAPRSAFASAEEAVALALEAELGVTNQIKDIMDLAVSERDHLTRNFLEWFMNEQLEEVASMETLLGMVRRAGESGLLFVENYLGRQGGRAAPSVAEAP